MPATSATAVETRDTPGTRDLNLLVLNLAMDAAHPVLGHTVAWTNELAGRARHVSVITMLAGEVPVRHNVTVHSLGKERGRSEPARLREFYRSVHRVLGEREIDACFAHMAPLFAALFAPVARRRRIPVLLWFAHSSASRTLRVAHALADRCVTSTPAAFPLPSSKLHVVGQGIDTARFAPPEAAPPGYERTLLSIGRLAPVKRVHEMIDAVAILEAERGLGLRLEVVGGPLTSADRAYADTLARRVRDREVGHLVTFHGPVPFGDVAEWYRRGAVFLNLTPSALDKAILEAMASGCVPVSSNPGFVAIARAHGLDPLVPGGGPAALAGAIASLIHAGPGERRTLAERTRRIVVEEHGLGRLADIISAHLAELAAQRANGGARRARAA